MGSSITITRSSINKIILIKVKKKERANFKVKIRE